MVTWGKRIAAFALGGMISIALCGSQALAEMRSDSVKRMSDAAPSAAVLDPAFGVNGSLTLPVEQGGWTAYGAATQAGDLVISGGSTLSLLSDQGTSAELFGGQGALIAGAPANGEFSLKDFTIDSKGRLLIVGTSRFPKAEDDVRHGPNGSPLPIVPSTVRIIRILPDGSPDSAFGQDGVVETSFGLAPPHDRHGRPLQPETSMGASGIAVDSQGRIVVTGGADIRLGPSCVHDIFEPVAVSAAFIARLTEHGALDPSFGGDGLVGGRKLGENPLHAESVGEPVIGPRGEITYRSTDISSCAMDHGRWGVAQLTSSGRTRKGLGRNGGVGGYFTAIASEPNGSAIALAKLPWTQGEFFKARLIRVSPDGKVDRSFGRQGQTIVKLGSRWGNEPDSLTVDSHGRILLGGTLVTSRRKRTPRGKTVSRGRRSILLVRLSPEGRQEMNFGPNGRVATSFSSLTPFGPSDLFFDPEGRLLTVHRYETREGSGLVLARYLMRN